MSSEEPGASPDADSSDSGLAQAVDSLLDWAQREPGVQIAGLPPLAPRAGLEPGARLGDYELVRRLGVGGMGVVFEGRQRQVASRRVAIKVLRTAFETGELARRFRREVTAVAALDHPGIVPIVDARVDEGTPYYVMKFLEGVSAARLLRELEGGAGIPPGTSGLRRFVESRSGACAGDESTRSAAELETSWEESTFRWVARIGLQVAEALQYAHEHGFVHRDVKPGNVMITPTGRAVLLDFGLVAAAGEEETLTQAGEFLGTLGYASPEQARGEPMDARSDVYSLGATLYELLALRRPFEARTRSELLARIEREEPAPLPELVPLDLRTIVGRALEKPPQRRYATAGALAADLRAFLAGDPIQARPPGRLERLGRALRGHPRLVLALGVAFSSLLGARAIAHRRAWQHTRAGDVALQDVLHERDLLLQLLARFDQASDAEPPNFLGLQTLRQEVAEARGRIDRGVLQTRIRYEQAFEHVAGYGRARRGLARLEAENLRSALAAYRDALAPAKLEPLEEALRRSDDEQRYAGLLDARGWVTITSTPAGAQVSVFPSPGPSGAGPQEPLLQASTPLDRLELEEGSYLAVITAEGFAAARLPFLVRRSACYDDDAARPSRELHVELLRPEEIPEGFVYVPAGETLVEDDPPRWAHVGSFLILRFEVSWEQMLSWTSLLRRLELRGVRLPEPVPFVRTDASGWGLAPGVHPRWPVQACAPMDVSSWAASLEEEFVGLREGWWPMLPSRAEWIRAARGADGRPYPWGVTFRWDAWASFVSSPRYGCDAGPFVVGAFPTDVSPFGVRDMAGSVAELTRDLSGPHVGEYVACGGSYRSTSPAEARVTAVRPCANTQPPPDVGFRVVLRQLPPWSFAPESRPGPFRDDFERPDSEDVGNGWIESAGVPLQLRTNPNEPERCTIEGGRLVLVGGKGDFSESCEAWHAIAMGDQDWSVRASMHGECESGTERTEEARAFGISVTRELVPRGSDILSLTVRFDGKAILAWSPFTGETVFDELDWPGVEEPLTLELRQHGRTLEGRVWPASYPRPEVPQLRLFDREFLMPAGFLGVAAPNKVGARVEVDRVEAQPAE